jgi:hypothetical protein
MTNEKVTTDASGASGALPSWNDGTDRQDIIGFVPAFSDRSSASFVPPEERVPVFANDGTPWWVSSRSDIA